MSNNATSPGQIISLPKGGGAQHGLGEKFSPDLHTGTGNFTVPIALPPGRNGFQPQLNLVYSTGNGNGVFGLGWGLSIPGVMRQTAKGIPLYQDYAEDLKKRDTFILSGAEDLVPLYDPDPAAKTATRYRPRTEGLFAKIIHHHDAQNKANYWEVRSKDGLISYYGTNPDDHPVYPPASPKYDEPAAIAKPDDPSRVFAWKLTLTKDPFDNRIEYLYNERDQSTDTDERNGHQWNQPLLKQIRYVDYGDRKKPEFLVTVTLTYEARQDPFSEYRPGFEIRASKRCKEILIETHADKVYQVRRYEFTYSRESDTLNGVSQLHTIDVVGFDDAGTEARELPPLEFGYTDFNPQDQKRRDFYPVQGADLPATSLANSSMELVGLFGNGLLDVLEMNGTVRYWRNRGNGQFDIPRPMAEAPAGVTLADPGVQIIDANGDGRADLLVTMNGLSGYFPLRFGGLWDHKSFQKYERAPSFNLEDPEVRLVDLTGDGVTDVIRSGTRLECFFNDPRQGWKPGNTRWVERQSIEVFPNVTFSDPRVKFGDMTGDGMQDIVLVYDGNLEYWPNLGHGNWGKRLHMKNSPRFPYGYDPKRILLGDVDGDGLADLIYVDDRKVTLWINQNGNGWSDPIEIPGTPPVSDMDATRLVDLLGSGISGVLWTRDATSSRQDHYFFLDLTGGTKPYVLHEMNNNMGAVTKVGYAPSTRFYLEDEKKKKTHWKTPLPFPVQVVARVEVIDDFSRGKLTTEYRYHHGYWDGAEREFRGFGMVEQFDTETFADYHQAGLHGDPKGFENVTEIHFSPPTCTKTWFHQGPVGEEFGEWDELDFSEEYWTGDPQLLNHTEAVKAYLKNLGGSYSTLTTQQQRKIKRDALRTLRGSLLRTELYALDGSPLQDRPYTVTEHAYGLTEIDPPPNDDRDRLHVFFPHSTAQRTTQWERGDDPMTSVTYSRDYDAFGNALTAIQVACPRGWRSLDDAVYGATYLATITTTQMAVPAMSAVYIHDRAARVSQYEIPNPPVMNVAAPGRTVADLLGLALDANALRIVSESIYFYDADPTQPYNGEFLGLPFGVLGLFGAITRSESLVLTDAIVRAAYGTQPPPYLKPGQPFAANARYPAGFVQQLAPVAGYVYHAPGGPYSGGYYASSERKRFDFHGAGAARGLVLASLDTLGAQSSIEYDQNYALLPVTVTDAANLAVRASYNYRVLQPEEITDANGNRGGVSFSPVGLVTAVYVRGKAGQNEGDLVRPSVVLEYDFLARPAWVRTIRSVRHDSDPSGQGETLESREYSDGFGRLIQTRTQGERVRFGDANFGGGASILPVQQSEGRGGTVQGVQNNDAQSPNVIVSGWQRYDNKGRVVEQFEPFFAKGWTYAPPRDSADPAQRDYGVKVTMFYDPRGRVLRTVSPDTSERRVIYGVPSSLDDPTDPDQIIPTPWESFSYDTNDNAGRTHTAASSRYRHHWNTPTSTIVDALGRTVMATVRNRARPASEVDPLPAVDEYRSRWTYDIQGNLLQLTDPLNRATFVYVYDLAKRALRIEGIDAGVRSCVFDALGHEIERSDSKGARTLRSYDVLARPNSVWARNDGNKAMTLRQRVYYGDEGDANQAANVRNHARAANLLGRFARQLDEAGELTIDGYDFKGNATAKVRRVIADAELVAALNTPSGPARTFTVDWDQLPALAGSYETSYTYDALNRKTTVQYPQDVEGARKTLVPRYNNAGALESMSLDGDVFVDRIAYNAKGQRVLVAYGNGLMTRYAYGAATLRLVRMRTEPYVVGELAYAPQGMPLQDFAYEYDLAGNVLSIVEQTPGCGVRNNARAALYPQIQAKLAAGDALVCEFEYDPLYRLTLATGREANDIPADGRPWGDVQRDGFDWGRPGTPTPSTARDATRLYQETYSYDAADNLLAFRHGTWTRYFGISGFSPAAWAQEWPTHLDPTSAWTEPPSNRLTHIGAETSAAQTHFFDANGNLVRENTERYFAWDAMDRVVAFANRTGGGNASVEACYLYDAAGQRAKKLVRKGQNIEVTVYVDGLFEHRISGGNENNALHVVDDRSRLALVRLGTALQGDTGPDVQYHLNDQLGSSHIVVGGDDSTGNAFTNREELFPYGETSFGSFGRKRYRFGGKERDEESGLFYFGARYFMAPGCRWISTDPITTLGTRSNPYVAFHDNPMTYVDRDGQFSITNHYSYTKSAAIDLGYDKTSADFIAHFASVYADHPKETIVLLNNGTSLGEDSNQLFRAYIDYSPTAQSQDTSSPVFSSWHAMAADNEKISAAAATQRGQEFGWSKIISAGEAYKSVRQQINYKEGAGYTLRERTLADIVRSNQSVLGDLGQGIHAFQDAIRHKGVDFAHHSPRLDQYPPAGEDKAATEAAYHALLVFELVSGDPKHLELLKTTTIDVSTASESQFKTIKSAAQVVLDKAKPDPDLVIRLHRKTGDVELRQQPNVTNRPDAGTKVKSQGERKR